MLNYRYQGPYEMNQDAGNLCASCRLKQDFQYWANADKFDTSEQRRKKRLSTTTEENRQLKRVIATRTDVQVGLD